MGTQVFGGRNEMKTRIISWRPDGLGDARTWAEVMAIVSETNEPVTITCPQLEGDYVIDPGNWDASNIRLEAPNALRVAVAKGATLADLASVSGPVRFDLADEAKPDGLNRHQRRVQKKLDRLNRR